jgi:hypothetical protein
LYLLYLIPVLRKNFANKQLSNKSGSRKNK